MTDTNKLKELAELASKATPGPWWIDSHGHHMVSESQDHRTVFLTNDGMGPATRHPETGNLSHWPNDWDASYIASADPTTILELIAEVERLRGKYTEALSREGVQRSLRTEAEAERDRLKTENEVLRTALEAFVLRADAYLEAGRGMTTCSVEVVLEKARAALEGGGR